MISVLVVDDDFMVARVHQGFIDKLGGFDVVGVAGTAADALAMAEQLTPDLILLDLYLPDRFGLDVVSDLRRAGSDCDIIVISAASESESVQAAVRHGVADYLLKPFTFADFCERLNGYAAHRSALATVDPIDQAGIDRLLARTSNRAKSRNPLLPKGLSAESAALVEQALRSSGSHLSASETAERVGLSRVSARRYLEHFVATGAASVSLKYGSSGRPERRYSAT